MKKTIKTNPQNLDPSYVYDFLPKTNCKECGEEKCMQFAEKGTNDQRNIEECIPLLKKRIKNYKSFKECYLEVLKKTNCFSEQDIENFLGGNALRFLCLLPGEQNRERLKRFYKKEKIDYPEWFKDTENLSFT